MGTVNSNETRESADVLIGMTRKEAKKYIKTHEVFFCGTEDPITEIRVSLKDGEPQSSIKDIRNSAGKVRLNVYTADDVIVQIDNVG